MLTHTGGRGRGRGGRTARGRIGDLGVSSGGGEVHGGRGNSQARRQTTHQCAPTFEDGYRADTWTPEQRTYSHPNMDSTGPTPSHNHIPEDSSPCSLVSQVFPDLPLLNLCHKTFTSADTDFQVYTRASLKKTLRGVRPGEAKIGYEVVISFIFPLYGRGHRIFIENFFTLVILLVDLAKQRTFGIGTVQSSHVGSPKDLTNKNFWSKQAPGSIGWRMQ